MPNDETTGWAIITKDGRVQVDSVSERRATAIEWAETQHGASWPTVRRHEGVKCRKVTVTVDTTDEEEEN